MTWLKLTTKALYLMDSSSNNYLKKVELKEHNPAQQEFKVSIPLEWFQKVNAPGKMSIELNPTSPEPDPPPSSDALKIFDKVKTTDKWGAFPVAASPFPRTNPKFIVIHNTADPNPPSDRSKGTENGAKQLAIDTQEYHRHGRAVEGKEPFADSGHNFLNTTGGFLLEGRHGSLNAIVQGQCVRSAHAAQDTGKLAGGNESPGIENEGNFMTFHMEQKQWDSLVALCAGICKSCNIDPSQIRGHRDFSFTDCPGDWLYSQLDKLRNEVRTKL